MSDNLHNKLAQYVVGATRTRYIERANPTKFKSNTTIANTKGLFGIAIGTNNDIYDVQITHDYNPVQSKDNKYGCGTISCTCMEFKMKNPEGTLAFKLDPCKHLLALAQRWLEKDSYTEEHTQERVLKVEPKLPTHIEIPNPTWVEQETPKAYLAKIAGIKRWWPKKHVTLTDTTTYITTWLAGREGVKGTPVKL